MLKIDLNNLGGQILLATPSMHQSIFKDAVIFICSHSEDGIRDAQESRGLGDVYKRQAFSIFYSFDKGWQYGKIN